MPNSAADADAVLGLEESAPATSWYLSSIREAIRCTEPINAPWPPPTIPNFKRLILTFLAF